MSNFEKVSGKIDLEDWTLDSIDKIKEAVGRIALTAAKETLDLAFDSGETSVNFPVIWGDSNGHHGKGVDDALTIYLAFDSLSDYNGNEPVYSFSINEMIDYEIEGMEDESFFEGYRRIIEGLRSAADRLEAAMQKDS